MMRDASASTDLEPEVGEHGGLQQLNELVDLDEECNSHLQFSKLVKKSAAVLVLLRQETQRIPSASASESASASTSASASARKWVCEVSVWLSGVCVCTNECARI
jgi:hypothetical protein